MSEHSWKELFPKQAAALEAAKAHHHGGQAYLFIGDSTEDLLTFAKGWAQTAACTDNAPDGSACGKCRNCQLFQTGNYSELFTLSPESKSAIIKVDDLRAFDHQMILTVPQGMIKFGIITEADAMQAAAANAFLKTLEEPPANVMFLLLTTRPQFLLPTIRSRCQNILLRTNSIDYSKLVPPRYLEILATLYRGAGTHAALAASRELTELFGGLKEEAEETVNENWDPSMDELAKNDKSLKKEMEELKVARIATEYAHLRASYLDSLQAWFSQRYLLAAGAPEHLLPQQEFVPLMKTAPKTPTTLEAEADLEFVETFRKSLRANLPEDLCLDALTLAICEKI